MQKVMIICLILAVAALQIIADQDDESGKIKTPH